MSVLPPTLKPANESTGLISISTWESNVCGDFELASVSVRCECDGREGYFVLSLIVSEDFPIMWGRESWGEVKKRGKPRLFCSGRRRYGYCERRGVRLVELEADFDTDVPAEASTWRSFEVKAIPSAQQAGLHCDPTLVQLKVVDYNITKATGKGMLTLRGSLSDPLDSIPILSIGDFTYVSGPTDWRFESERKLCDGEAYLPWLVGRHYDHLGDFRVGAGMVDFHQGLTTKSRDARPRTYSSALPGCVPTQG